MKAKSTGLVVAALLAFQFAASYAVEPHLRNLELYRVPGMYFYSDDGKAAFISQAMLTSEMREHINKSRWSKGQYKLPTNLFGLRKDLDGDGHNEIIIETDETQEAGKEKKLVIQVIDGRAKIVGAVEGQLGIVKREGGWDDLIEFKGLGGGELTRTRLRFDGTVYRRVEVKEFWKWHPKDNNESNKSQQGKPR